MTETEDNVLILNKVLHMLNRYSFDRDVTYEENVLIKRLMNKVGAIAEDYVECFKAKQLNEAPGRAPDEDVLLIRARGPQRV